MSLFAKAKRYLFGVESSRWTGPSPGANVPNEAACVFGFKEQSKPVSKGFLNKLFMIPFQACIGPMLCDLKVMERLVVYLMPDNFLQHATRAT